MMKISAYPASGRSGVGPAEAVRSPKRRTIVPCVFCGRGVETKRSEVLRGPDSFAVCQEDDARLDAAIDALTADVLALLDGREARQMK